MIVYCYLFKITMDTFYYINPLYIKETKLDIKTSNRYSYHHALIFAA